MTSEHLLKLIALGENPTLEFKSTMRFDLRQGKVNKDLTKVVAKTIAGFLNCHGGTLLIGVDDEGNILGIEKDLETLSRKTTDYYDLTLRNALGLYLGVEISSRIQVLFLNSGSGIVVSVVAAAYHEPVFFQDGESREFYVRDGNATRPLNVMSAHRYITNRFPPPQSQTDVPSIVRQVIGSLGAQFPPTDRKLKTLEGLLDSGSNLQSTIAQKKLAAHPPWLKIANTRVIDVYLRQLALSVEWKRLHIISPWISEFNDGATLRFSTFLDRIVEDQATVYLVTRPPEEDWHEKAIRLIANTRRANIVYVKNLHAKLYTASTSAGDFALLGSANFTQRSLDSPEIGMLVNGSLNGKPVLRRLQDEARKLYRHPERTLEIKASFSL